MALTALLSFTVPSDLPSLSFLVLVFPSVLVQVGLLDRLGVPPPFGVCALEALVIFVPSLVPSLPTLTDALAAEPLVRVLIPVAAVAVESRRLARLDASLFASSSASMK